MRNGFTLIELLVVVLIIGVLAAIALPQYQNTVYRARIKEAEINMDAVYKGGLLFALETGTYPKTFEEMTFALPDGCQPGAGFGIAGCLDKLTCGNTTYCLTDYGVVSTFGFNSGFCSYCHFNKMYSGGAFVCRFTAAEVSAPSYFYRYCQSMGYFLVTEP